MKRKITRFGILFFLLAFLNMGAFAQVQVGTGTNTSQNLPIDAFYGYSYSQVIYLASEINASGTITELQWYFAGSTLSNSNDWTIYIGHTSKTSFSSTTDWVPVSSMTQVYSGVFTDPGTAGWITFDITDWAYNGTDNIVVAVDENASGYNSSSDKFYCTSVTGNRGIEYHNDSNNPDPSSPPTASGTPAYIANIIFGGITQSCPAPTAQTESNITTTSADLGWTTGGSSTWDIEWGPTGFTQGSGTIITGTTDNPYTLSGLTQSTIYDWYVRDDCGGGDESSWTGPSTFTTAIACPAPTAQTETNITTTSADLDWTTGGASTWNIEWGPTGFTQGSGTMITGTTTNPYALSGLTAATTYDWYVQDDCGGDQSTWVGPSTFTTACTSVSVPWNEGFEGMPSVGAGIIPNCMAEDGDWTTADAPQTYNRDARTGTNYIYTNYSADDWLFSPPIDLTGGTSYDFSFWYVTDGNSGWTTVEAKYGTGQTSGDMTTAIGTPVSGPTNTTYVEYRGSFTPATSGTYYMGIHVVATSSPWYITFDDLACELTPSCPAPTAQTESNITATSADLGWTPGGSETTWNIEWGPTGFTQGSGTMITGTGSNPYSLTGLSPTTTYDWYVQTDCGGGSSSTWTGPSTFTTACATFSTPFSEDFSSSSTPTCWDNSGAESWLFSTGAGYGAAAAGDHTPGGGTNYAWIDGSGDIQQNALVTPYMDVSGLTTPAVEFYFFSNNTNNPGDDNTLTVDFWDGAAWNNLLTYSGDDASWQQGLFDLSGYTITGDVQFRFIVTGTAATQYYNDILVDDVSVMEMPSCPAPTVQNETNITATSADLGWTENGTATTWNIEWGPTGFTQGSGTTIAVTSNPYNLTGLTEATTYDWYVQADCGGDQSTWIGPGTFTTTVACPAPTNQTETNITTTSADLDWTNGGSETAWNIEYGPAGFTQGSGTTQAVSAHPYTLSGLTASTTYDWYVQADCGGGSSSTWTGPGTFTTSCNDVTSFPFTENFEGAVPPGCWSEVRTPSSSYGWSSNSSGYTGKCARFDSYLNSSGNVSELITNTLDLSSLTTAQLKFVFKNPTGGDFSVLLSTDGGATYPNIIWTGLTGQTDWLEKTADITSYIGSNVKIAFKGTSNYGNGDAYIYLDDVTVEEIPSCPAPSAQTETNITMTSADLGWTENGTATTWNIEWGPTGFTQGSGTMITGTTTNPYSLSGLTASTTYDWYVQSGCGSTWTGPSTFTTLCGTTSVPYFENFDGVTAPAFPPCMTVEDVNGDNIVWETTTAEYVSPPNSAMITYNTSLNMDDWFFTQGLQLTGGVTYEVSFAYTAASDSYPEKLAVDWGNAANAASMSGTPIFDDNNVTVGWWAGSGTFTPTSSGTYYVGFHGYSDMNEFDLYVDDVKVLEQVTVTTWNGSVDHDWDKPGNWTGGLPSSGTAVTIPTGLTNYPTLSSATTIGSLLVESDAAGDASILNDGLLIVTGNATVQRYVTGGVWHDVSASTQGQTLNSLYFNHSPDVWLRHYNEPDNTRTYVYQLTDPMPPGAGYEIWVETGNNVTINYTGALQRSNVTLTTTSTPPLSYSGPEPLGYNLIGNPFASPLDLDEGAWSLTDVTTSFWVWDPNSGTSGTFLDWNTSSGTGSLTGGIIPMGQGFFIQATGTAPSITIPMAARVHSATGFYKNSAAEDGDGPMHMSLRALMDNGYDEMNIAFIEEASEEFDTYDTRKMFAFEGDAPQIYSEQYGEQFSINGLPLLTKEGYDVKVGYKAGVNGDQTLEADLKYLPETEVLLEDLLTGNVQNLVDEPVYKFEAYVDDDPVRFVLHFNPVYTGVEGQADDLGIKVYAFDGSVYIQSKGKTAKEKKEVWIYDMFGRTVLETTAYPSTLNRIPVNVDNAFVIVRTVCESGVTTSKVYIK